ncbi:hypothetical protein ACWD7T_25600, partial [Streptomyces sp. 900116325]
MDPINLEYQYWCEECARALIIKGDPIETYRELELGPGETSPRPHGGPGPETGSAPSAERRPAGE